jgi:hypothetical protein
VLTPQVWQLCYSGSKVPRLIAREWCADRSPIVLIFGIKNLLIPALSCRSCRPTEPFAELGRLSRTSIANEMRDKHRAQVLSE